MSTAIESEAHYRHALKRATALRDHVAAIRAVQALASANRFTGCVEPEDLRDLAALDDALADIGFTLRDLEGAIADWEDVLSFGARDNAAANRAWHFRRLL